MKPFSGLLEAPLPPAFFHRVIRFRLFLTLFVALSTVKNQGFLKIKLSKGFPKLLATMTLVKYDGNG